MGTGSPGPEPPAARPVFSPDGFWWWDGAQWRPALSPDGLWRWNGQAWEPSQTAARPAQGSSAATVAGITIAAVVGVLVLVSAVTVAILYFMGNQIANVFSNVSAALGSTPSP